MKQIIVIRKDLKMRRGKEITQGCHASMAFLLNRLPNNLRMSVRELTWVNEGQRKITLQVDSEEELREIYAAGKKAIVESWMITDLGLTELKEPTVTAVALGPDEDALLDSITGHLKLY